MDKSQSVFEIIRNLHSETKLQLLSYITKAEKPMNVSDLSKATSFQRKNVSKQLNELRKVGVLEVTQVGKERFYSLSKGLTVNKKNMVDSILCAYTECDCSPQALKTL